MINPSSHTNHDHPGASANFHSDAYLDTYPGSYHGSHLKNGVDFFGKTPTDDSSRFNSRTRNAKPNKVTRQTPIGITEITASLQNPYPSYLLAPFLSGKNVQSDERWITCVTTKQISREECESLGINTQQLRIIRVAKTSDILWVSWEALAAGNSRCVLSILESISSEESQQLNSAAILGKCHGLLLSTEKSCQRSASLFI